jgi:hypothetical protein
MAISTRRWRDRDHVWFAVAGLDDALTVAVERAGYRWMGEAWARAYPVGAAHLDQAWATFSREIERMLRQAARLDPVPCEVPPERWTGGQAALAVPVRDCS